MWACVSHKLMRLGLSISLVCVKPGLSCKWCMVTLCCHNELMLNKAGGILMEEWEVSPGTMRAALDSPFHGSGTRDSRANGGPFF